MRRGHGQAMRDGHRARRLHPGATSRPITYQHFSRGSPDQNLFGFHDIPCDEDTGRPCVTDIERDDCIQGPPPSVTRYMTDQSRIAALRNYKPVNCILREEEFDPRAQQHYDRKTKKRRGHGLNEVCYCCCAPYKPDPCTGFCVLNHKWERYKTIPKWSIMQRNCQHIRSTTTPPFIFTTPRTRRPQTTPDEFKLRVGQGVEHP